MTRRRGPGHPAPRARVGPRGARRARPPAARRRADRGPGRRGPADVARSPTRSWSRRSRCSPTPPRRPALACVLAVRGVLARVAGAALGGRARRPGAVLRPAVRCRPGARRAAAQTRTTSADEATRTTVDEATGPRRRRSTRPSTPLGRASRPARRARRGRRVRRPRTLVGRRRRVAAGRPADAVPGDHRGDGRAAAAWPGRSRERRARSTRPSARRTCARRCGPRCATAPSGSRSSAAPGTPRRSTASCPTAAADAGSCAGCRKVRQLGRRWVPWTSSRLATASGYGAGIVSPGWYHHLFTAPDHAVARWLTRVAGVLRAEDLPVSSAHVIEAVRLAEALAALRGRPLAGPRRGHRGDPRGAVRRRRARCSTWCTTAPRRRRGARRTCPPTVPTVPLEADLRAHRPAAAAEARGARAHARPRPAQGHRPAALAAAAPAAAARRRLGRAGAATRGAAPGRSARPGAAVGARSSRSRSSRPPCGARRSEAAAARGRRRGRAAADLAGLTALVDAASCSPTCPTRCPAAARVARPRGARPRRRPPHGGAAAAGARAALLATCAAPTSRSSPRVADALLVRVCAGLPAAVTGSTTTPPARCATPLDAVHAAVLLARRRGRTERWLRRACTGSPTATTCTACSPGARPGCCATPAGSSRRRGRPAAGPGAVASAPTPAKAAWVEGFLAGGGLLLVARPRPARRCSTPGWRAWPSRTSSTSCRCCGARSARSPPPERRRRRAVRAAARGARRPTGRAAPTGTSTSTGAARAAAHGRADPGGAPHERPVDEAERLRRWRLVLGGGPAERRLDAVARRRRRDGRARSPRSTTPAGRHRRAAGRRQGGLGARRRRSPAGSATSAPTSRRTVVQVMQRDAIERLDLTRCCSSPSCSTRSSRTSTWSAPCSRSTGSCPRPTKATARQVVATVVERDRAADRRRAPGPAVTGALDRSARTHRPRPRDIDWDRTIRANLTHYLPEHRTVVPERLVGYGRRQHVVAARRRARHRPVRLDGRLGRLRVGVRRGARVDALAAHVARGLRHRRRRPDRPARRPGRRAVRHPARRRHRHQPRDRVLPGARHPARATRSSC